MKKYNYTNNVNNSVYHILKSYSMSGIISCPLIHRKMLTEYDGLILYANL